MEEGVPIEHRLITRAIANAQEKVEAHNFDIRKHLLEYDDVLNKQREVDLRPAPRAALAARTCSDEVLEMAEGLAEDAGRVGTSTATRAPEEWDWKALDDAVFAQFNLRLQLPDEERERADASEALRGACSSSACAQALRASASTSFTPAGHAAAREARSCCRRSTRCGRTTSSTWTT